MHRIVVGLVCGLALLLGVVPAEAGAVAPATARAATPAPVAKPVTPVRPAPRAGNIFNDPKGTKDQQRAIIIQINKGIDAAPRGSTIRMAQYLFDINSTANKLVIAFRRGVHVQVLVDDNVKTAQISRVRLALGTDKRKTSYVATCRHSCMSNAASVMHAKFYLFSRAANAPWVSMISSANPFTGNTYNSWNDVRTIVGNKTIYNSLSRYFDDMLLDRTNHDYYRTTVSGIYKLYMFPRAARTGVNTVVLLDQLNKVRCTGAAAGYGSKGRTVVRVAQWGWTSARNDLARKLWSLHNSGCKVQVIYNSGVTSRSVTAILLKRSARYGVIPVYDAWVDKNHDGHARLYMHLKLVTINGNWFGHRNAKVVFTGSQNFTGPATRVNNDMILRIFDGPTHDAYIRQTSRVRDNSTKRVTVVPPLVVARSVKRINTLTSTDGD